MTYWQSWHGAYGDPASSLSRRLRAVQDQVGRWLDTTAPRRVRVVSLCAGDGRDLLDVLATRDDAGRVTGTLVELDPDLAEQARARARSWPGIEVRTADAGEPGVYADLPPADLVLLCGVLGNVSDADVEHVVSTLPALCAPLARVIWTRTRRAPDLTPRVRTWFGDSGFREIEFVPIPNGAASVGVADLVTAPRSGLGPERLFTFVSDSANRQTLDVYEQRADRYEHTLEAPGWHVAFLDRFAGLLQPGAAVLELGSGTGRDARYLAGRGLAVQPSDAVSSFVDRMRGHGLDPLRIDLLTDDLGGPWDAVVALAVLLHLEPSELDAALGRIHDAVRPDGLLALSVKEGDGSAWSDHKLGLPRFFRFWRPDALRHRLEDHGWAVEAVERHAGRRDDWILVIARRRERSRGYA